MHSSINLYLLIIIALYNVEFCQAKDENIEELGISATELIRLRGFKAEDHYFVTSDGYILHLIKATNPLINNGASNKTVIFFLHGSIVNSKCFFLLSKGSYPVDYSRYNASSMSSEELLQLFGNNRAKFSTVLTAINFGHECWLLDRRGTKYSQGHVDYNKRAYLNTPKSIDYSNVFNNISAYDELRLKKELNPLIEYIINNSNFTKGKNMDLLRDISSLYNNNIINIIRILLKPNFSLSGLQNTFNPKYWDFSIDEHALIDFVEVIDYVLYKTGRSKLSVVGDSLGAAIPLYALSFNKELNHKRKYTI